jgi:hypothetical protein
MEVDYESIPNGSLYANLMAGALAGITEHTVMYPLDAVKVMCIPLYSLYGFVLNALLRF